MPLQGREKRDFYVLGPCHGNQVYPNLLIVPVRTRISSQKIFKSNVGEYDAQRRDEDGSADWCSSLEST